MTRPSTRRSPCLVLLLATVASAPALGSGPTLTVEMYGDADHGGSLTLSIDGKGPCTAKVPTAEGLQRLCSLALGEGARRIRVTGDVSWKRDGRARSAKGVKLVEIVDVAPLMAPLRDGSLPFGQRMEQLLRAHEAFAAARPELAELAAVSLEPGEPVPAEQIAEAEQRLGFPLPAEHVSLLRTVGALGVDDSSFTGVADLARADRQMVHDWGTPADVFRSQTSATDLATFRDSTILFTEVGDGLGGLLYRPSGPAACGGEAAYYWYHQESGVDAELLRNRDGRCKSYPEALVWLLATQVLVRYEDESEGVLVDSSAPGETKVRLFLEGGSRDAFAIRMETAWDGAE